MRKHILLIDDERAICHFTKLNLERAGDFEVTVAYSGEEGLRKAKEIAFDLVITDYRMPGINGIMVLDALKASDARRPVVLFTIYHDDDSKINREIRAKADGILSKPIDRRQLLAVIEDALSRAA